MTPLFVEKHFRQLKSFKSLAALEVQGGPQKIEAQAVFIFGAPDRVRLEILGPFFLPQWMLIRQDGRNAWSPEPPPFAERIDVGAGLDALSGFLSGRIFADFDGPQTRVSMDKGLVRYEKDGRRLYVDPRLRIAVGLSMPKGAAGAFDLVLGDYRNIDGLWTPHRVSWSLGGGAKILMKLRRGAVNEPLDSNFFAPAAGDAPAAPPSRP
jgi:hypothetical protein